MCGNADTVAAELNRRLAAMGGADVLLVQVDQGGLPTTLVHECLDRLATDVVAQLAVPAPTST